MQFASVQEPARNIGGLKGCPLGWRMRRQVAADPHQDVAALAGLGPSSELAHPGLQHLAGMEPRILPKQRVRECRNQVIGRVPQCKMPRHEAAHRIHLPLPVEGVEQGRADILGGLGKARSVEDRPHPAAVRAAHSGNGTDRPPWRHEECPGCPRPASFGKAPPAAIRFRIW